MVDSPAVSPWRSDKEEVSTEEEEEDLKGGIFHTCHSSLDITGTFSNRDTLQH